MNLSVDEELFPDSTASSNIPSKRRPIHRSTPAGPRAPLKPQSPQRSPHPRINPLLHMSIGRRLALGFLLPALLAAFTLSTVGVQSQQHLLQESTYYQNLLYTYTSLTTGADLLTQMHGDLQATATSVSQLETLRDDQTIVHSLSTRFSTILANLQQGLLAQYPDLLTLLTEAGHGDQAAEQQGLTAQVQANWQAYHSLLEQVLHAIAANNSDQAHTLVLTQEDTIFNETRRSLQSLVTFDGQLGTSLHDAASVEVQKLFVTTILAILGLLLGIGLVGWLISSTLVRRLQRLRAVAQAITHGKVDTRLEVSGSDEIADVSKATNIMLDTLVGLLEETERQRDKLASAQHLQRLHAQLQREHEALNEANARLAALATTDVLTGLPNHRALQEQIEKEIEQARLSGRAFSLLFFDGDRFKRVNDIYGHATGDVVLRELGARVHSVLRGRDTLGRYGGEEFIVLLPETEAQEAREVAERMRAAVAAQPLAQTSVEGGINATISIGMATYPDDGQTGKEVLEKADQAMYWAKRLGRNQVRCAPEAEYLSRDSSLTSTIKELERHEEVPADAAIHEQKPRAEELELLYSLMWMLNLRDHNTFTHSHEVSDLATAIACEMGLEEQMRNTVATAGLLHDIGKIAIPDALLQKSSSLSPDEWAIIKQHPALGAQVLEVNPALRSLIPAIRHHHERWDGCGYPDELVGEHIPLEARIIAVAEAYQVLRTDHPYQVARTQVAACSELERCAGSQFDPGVVQALLCVIERQQQGTGNFLLTRVH